MTSEGETPALPRVMDRVSVCVACAERETGEIVATLWQLQSDDGCIVCGAKMPRDVPVTPKQLYMETHVVAEGLCRASLVETKRTAPETKLRAIDNLFVPMGLDLNVALFSTGERAVVIARRASAIKRQQRRIRRRRSMFKQQDFVLGLAETGRTSRVAILLLQRLQD